VKSPSFVSVAIQNIQSAYCLVHAALLLDEAYEKTFAVKISFP
jgi:hypothetical protein